MKKLSSRELLYTRRTGCCTLHKKNYYIFQKYPLSGRSEPLCRASRRAGLGFFCHDENVAPPSVLRIRFTHGVKANESGRADLIFAIPARQASSWPRTCPSKSPGTNTGRCTHERHNHVKSPFECFIPTTHAQGGCSAKETGLSVVSAPSSQWNCRRHSS